MKRPGEGRDKTLQEEGMGCTHPLHKEEQQKLEGMSGKMEHRH